MSKVKTHRRLTRSQRVAVIKNNKRRRLTRIAAAKAADNG
jgi:hypothetical protein